MAKAKFDRNEVIGKSINLFWRNGFSGSSMQQIVDTTGLKPGSIYHSFGNKELLFKESLDGYAEQAIANIRSILDDAPDTGSGIIQILEMFLEESKSEDYNSCFLIKTQLELAAEDNVLYESATAKLKQIENVFRSYLEKEHDERLSKQRAGSLMLHIFGMRVYGYRQDSAGAIIESLKEGLPWLPWGNSDTGSGVH